MRSMPRRAAQGSCLRILLCRLEEPGIKHHLSYTPGLFLPHFHLLHAQQEGLVHGLHTLQLPHLPYPAVRLGGRATKDCMSVQPQEASVCRAALSAHSGAFQRHGRPRGIFVMGFINKCTDLLNLSGCIPEINLGNGRSASC